MNFFGWLRSFRSRAAPPAVRSIRASGAKAAVVFVHGFSGSLDSWDQFSRLLSEDDRIADWDLFAIGYATGLRVDIPNVWTADPDLSTCARQLRTAVSTSPLSQYASLTLVAHSMGGLVVQQAIIDDEMLRRRLAHVVLYGTPSRGLGKARAGSLLKRQFRDMSDEGNFITSLRSRWDSLIGVAPVFSFLAVAGEVDQFVPPKSSLSPFPDNLVRVIPGDHLQIIAPEGPDHLGYALLADVLRGANDSASGGSGARLAAERGEHQKVVDTLSAHATDLDDGMLQTLALSLDTLGRGAEALALLQTHLDVKKPTSNILGILGGRVKRRWLVERRAEDLRRAQELYSEGLREAEAAGSAEQVQYHAINLAFLALLSEHPDTGASEMARGYAKQALAACIGVPPTAWQEATKAEANLILGDIDAASAGYGIASRTARSIRDRESMYSQAIRVAGHLLGDDGVGAIEKAFGVKSRAGSH